MSMIGKTLGHYEITSQLGKGGMGEVYRADDLNLNRKIALKLLPDAFASDPERMARFEREAKLLASLNHTNIAAIYGLEQAEGKRFLVLELVEGETLAQRISRGPLPVEEALAICRQIADGLEAAHDKGVIHRDLKPANVMITDGDKVKILDFGLAKALSDETQAVDASQSPTLTEAMTRPGVILGTAAYMSPEQAKGKSVDKRADIWAFGCILYECLTGKRAFEGETVTETLAAILRGEPDLEALPAATPANIRFVLRRCLDKDITSRLHCVGDLRILMEHAGQIVEKIVPEKRSWPLVTVAAIASLLVIVMAVPTFLYFRGSKPTEAMRFDITVPSMPNEYSMTVSPNGRWIAFVAFSSASIPSLFVREISSATSRQIEGTEGAKGPFWSPDSRSIGFSAGRTLKSVDISSGSPLDICPVGNFTGGTWNQENVIIFGDWPVLHKVSARGGESTVLTVLDKSRKESAYSSPLFLPDGQHYLYASSLGTESGGEIFLGSLDSKKQVRLLAATAAIYAEPGYLLFQRGRTLFAQPFDEKRLTLSGDPVGIADNLLVNRYGTAAFSASQNGLLIYRSGQVKPYSQFVWFDRTGKQLGLAGEPSTYLTGFDLSPDGKRIVVVKSDLSTSNNDIWLIELARDRSSRLTFGSSIDDNPVWFRDGEKIGFTSQRRGNPDIYEMNTSGIGQEQPIVESDRFEWMEDCSKDGRYIASVFGVGLSSDLYAIPLFGDRKPFPIVQLPSQQDEPHFSFDGKWLAYDSDESGTWQVYVVSFPTADQRRPISTSGGAQPRWRSDGKELFYLSLDGKMMAVDIKADKKIEAAIPRELFSTGLQVDPINDQYSVTSDGQRFLVLKSLSEEIPIPIAAVPNWTVLIKK